MRSFLIALTRNPISLLGCAVTTAAAVLIVSLFVIELFGFLGNPYIGILAYLVLPALFLGGLALIPVGIAWERRRVRRAAALGEKPPGFPVIDLNLDRTRSWVLTVVLLTAVNVIILAAATFKGVEVMESTEFCGLACHSVMQPEHTAYERSAHSRVKCVSCHIGPGADWFVKSKLSGAWQVVSVTFDLYPRPIPTPVHDLRPARETCEQCHWPQQFVGDRLTVGTRFGDDEANTERKTVLLMRVGGLRGRSSQGIHWHVDPDVTIRYRSDETREEIHEVELTEADGTVKVFHPGGTPRDPDAGEDWSWRVMDCIDCHNRPTHQYRFPDEEVDLAIEQGRISRELPFVRREGVRLLEREYASHEEARREIPAGLLGFYAEQYPDTAATEQERIADAAQALVTAYVSNVFPSMKVTWGTYPDHIGHERFTGCFRCHNDDHATTDGETISQDCFACHSLLAIEEEDPEILSELEP